MYLRVIKKRKKSGGVYYILQLKDKYFSQILGRYKNRSGLQAAINKYKEFYGINKVIVSWGELGE